jgi:hypothetical protein
MWCGRFDACGLMLYFIFMFYETKPKALLAFVNSLCKLRASIVRVDEKHALRLSESATNMFR